MGRPKTVDDQQVKELLADGHTLPWIMAELGCKRSTLFSARRRLGLPTDMKRGPEGIDIEQVEWLTRDGWSAPRIAQRLGCCKRTVERARRKIREGMQ